MRDLRGWRWAALVGLIAAMAVVRCFVRPVIVVGNSMSPSLRAGQIVWMRCNRPGDAPLQPGDVIVFRHKGITQIKRVYSVGGTSLQVARFWNEPGRTEPLGSGRYAFCLRRLANRCPDKVRIGTVSLPQDTVFLVGDNTTCSVDSRDFGPIPVREVWGRVLLPVRSPARRLAMNH